MRFLIVVFLLLSSLISVNGQSIFGIIYSEKGHPISGASVIIYRANSLTITAFDITKLDGSFRLNIDSNIRQVRLRVSALGYQDVDTLVRYSGVSLVFKLRVSSIQLKEVVVHNNSIFKQKDTLNYSVQSFTNKSDRVIGDVIKRMPGLEVMESGAILYQGRAIQALLVNGMDLLEGKYGLTTMNLPMDAVGTLQVIENDQRIRVLDSLIPSNLTTINLKLKRFVTVTPASLSTGAAPFLREVGVTPIVYNKVFHMIGSFQTTNLGIDYSKQLVNLTSGGEGLFVESSPELITPQLASMPPIDQKFWLNNDLHMATLNLLKVSKSGIQNKINLSFLTDKQYRYSGSIIDFTSADRAIRLIEDKRSNFKKNELKISLITENNTAKVYFKNILSYESSWNKNANDIFAINRSIYERFQSVPNFQISNITRSLIPVGKQLLNFVSTIRHKKNDIQLNIAPGQFDSLINNDKPYDELMQGAISTSLHINETIGIVKAFGSLTFAPKVGIDISENSLLSKASKVIGSTNETLPALYQNQISLLKRNIFSEISLSYKRGPMTTNLDAKFSYLSIKKTSDLQQSKVIDDYFLLEPRFSFQYKASNNIELNYHINYGNRFGDIGQLYDGYLIQNYRNIQKMDGAIPRSNSFVTGTYISYKETLKGFFASLGYTFSKQQLNLFSQSFIDSIGFISMQSQEMPNDRSSNSIDLTLSKYFAKIKTVIKGSGKASFNKSDQIINSIYNTIDFRTYGVTVSLTNTFFKWASFNYGISIQSTIPDFNGVRRNNTFRQIQNLDINIFSNPADQFSFSTKYYHYKASSISNTWFSNLSYRHVIQKKKIDIEVAVINLLNTDRFVSVLNEGYMRSEVSSQLRPRQIVGTVRFRL